MSPPPSAVYMPAGLLATATAPTQISALSLHDALPISARRPPVVAEYCRRTANWRRRKLPVCVSALRRGRGRYSDCGRLHRRSEEHTSELQSRGQLVCRLLLEKKRAGSWAYMHLCELWR